LLYQPQGLLDKFPCLVFNTANSDPKVEVTGRGCTCSSSLIYFMINSPSFMAHPAVHFTWSQVLFVRRGVYLYIILLALSAKWQCFWFAN